MNELYRKVRAFVEKRILRTRFDNGILDDSFKKRFLELPVGFIHVQVEYRDNITGWRGVDNAYGGGVSRMFDRIKDLVGLRDRGVATVTVEPYRGRTLQAYLNLTWDKPECW